MVLHLRQMQTEDLPDARVGSVSLVQHTRACFGLWNDKALELPRDMKATNWERGTFQVFVDGGLREKRQDCSK